MTLQTFFTTWNGKYNNFDGKFGTQCTDLMRQYVQDVCGFKPYIAIPQTGWAKNIFTNFKNNTYFTKILNTPTGIPKQGDILFFKTSLTYPWIYGWAGHVGIVHSASLMSIVLFEQNWPTGSACKLHTHTYKDCLGWLQRK